MKLHGWVRAHRVVIALSSVAAGALACSDTTKPKAFSTEQVGEPSLTLASGFVGTPNGRGNVGTFHVKSKADGYKVDLKSNDNTDIVVSDIVVAAGGHSGWHTHPGPALVVVKSGAITFYHGDDRTCTGTRYPAGSAFIEEGGTVGIARNEEPGQTVLVATFFVPRGGASRLDAARPGNCPF